MSGYPAFCLKCDNDGAVSDHAIVSEEVVQTWRTSDGHTASLVRFAEDTDAGLQMGYQVHCSLCGWLAGGGENERPLVVEEAEYHVGYHDQEARR